ncbi:hypothetical protein BAOM_2787 [Peribacillus asahii]|uniref:Uncharacterized protein n=1 Tax=Peribacillus asahii TaxID=228899 RepID=A0A3T0KSM0_9BACI|nr:hypothetical protein BAOM_2787 [Peribacillus asahii]
MNVVLVSQKTNKLLRGLIAETEEFNNEYIFTTVYRNIIEKVRLMLATVIKSLITTVPNSPKITEN